MKLNGFIRFMLQVTGGDIVVGDIVSRPEFHTFEYAGFEYRCLTAAEADELVRRYVIEALPAADPVDVAGMLELPLPMVEALQALPESDLEKVISRHYPDFVARVMGNRSRGELLAPFDRLEQKCGDLFFYRVS